MQIKGLWTSTILLVAILCLSHARAIDLGECIRIALLNLAAVLAIIPAVAGGSSKNFWIKYTAISLSLILIGLLPVLILLTFKP